MMNGQSSITVSAKPPPPSLCGAITTRTLIGSARSEKNSRASALSRARRSAEIRAATSDGSPPNSRAVKISSRRAFSRAVSEAVVCGCASLANAVTRKVQVAGTGTGPGWGL